MSGDFAATDEPKPAVHAALLRCHRRVRLYMHVAWNLADIPLDDLNAVRHSAAVLARYFGQAFPLHTADENDSLMPRLRATVPRIQTALDRMALDHVQEAEHIHAVIRHCESIAENPHRLETTRRSFRRFTRQLTVDLESHLVAEERYVFPHIRLLSESDQQAILEEMAARRKGLSDSFLCTLIEP